MIRSQRLIQILSFGAFSFLLAWAVYPETLDLPLDAFLKLDPVIALTTLLASREFRTGFLISALVVASGLMIGRAFCGYVCPMGTIIDVLQRVIYPRSKLKSPQKGYDSNSKLRSIKYYILIIVLLAAIGGISLAFLVSPVS
ncbi:MAG: 4Fe-4S binding protein, partial [Deltaproteobacteria bacterium]|nr:4Fe-4S binding protein [Deltaproteobacteria bacterium]